MADLLTVAGGLFVAMLVVGGALYLLLGRSLDLQWDSESLAENGPEE